MSAASSAYDEDNAADDEYGNDEAGEMNEHHQGNMGRGAEHANEQANVPATTPVPGGNAPAHEEDDEDDHSARGGTANSGTGDAGGYSRSDSGSTTMGTAGSHASSPKSHGNGRD